LEIFNSNVLYHLREFSFKTNQTDVLFTLAPKMKKIGDLVEKHQETKIHSDDRLTLHDYRLTDSFSNMGRMLSWMNHLGLCDEGSFLDKIKKNTDELKTGMDKIEERFDKSKLSKVRAFM
jgi:hypothetical protein